MQGVIEASLAMDSPSVPALTEPKFRCKHFGQSVFTLKTLCPKCLHLNLGSVSAGQLRAEARVQDVVLEVDVLVEGALELFEADP